MTTLRTLGIACLIAAAAGSSASAQRLGVQGKFTLAQVMGQQEVNRVIARRQQIINWDQAAYRSEIQANQAYRQTGGRGHLFQLQRIQSDRARAKADFSRLGAVLSQPTTVRLVAGRGPAYDRLPQIRWDESVVEFLRRNRKLIGYSITVNARHLAGGGSTASRPTTSRSRGRLLIPSGTTFKTPIIPGGLLGQP